MVSHPVSRDRNYTVTLEYGGWAEQRHVVRYCGEFISSHLSYSAAVGRAVGDHARRQGAPIVVAKP